MSQHVMLDLETWGKGSTAQIISIGAVKFDPTDPGGPFDNFHVAIDPSACSKALRDQFEVDPGTVMWWMDPKRQVARDHWMACEKLDLPSALVGFAEWFGPDSLPTWGNGATFDNVIMLHAIAACGFDRPWGYRDDRCYRTLRAEWPDVPWLSERELAELLLSAPVQGVGGAEDVPHTALYDAQAQALHLRRIYAAKALRDPLRGPIIHRHYPSASAVTGLSTPVPSVLDPHAGLQDVMDRARSEEGLQFHGEIDGQAGEAD